MASTKLLSNSENEVIVSKSVAKILQGETVMVDLFGELMDVRFSIDRSTIASGKILVTQGDPEKVAEIIHKVVGEIDVLAVENDEEVLNVLNSLKEKFPGQFETDFERSSSTFKSAFHRKVKTEVEPEIASLATKTGRFAVSRQHMNYLQCHLDHIQGEVHASWPDSAVSITVQMEDRGQGSLLVSSKRFDFEGVKGFIENFAADVQKHSTDLEPLRALFLSSTRGQKEVRRLEREHNCRVSILFPGHQVLVRAEDPTGHRLFLCEGNMAATDCNILMLPFSENQRDWTPTHKMILERGLLTTKTEQYARFIGCSPKARILKLQNPRPDEGQIVVLLHVPDQPDCHLPGAEGLADGLAEALRLSCSRGACIALPLPLSVQQSLNENLKIIVRVLEDCLDEEENATTIVLYLEKSSAATRQQLVETLEKTMSSSWKAMTDLDAVYEENCSSSPVLAIVGQTRDIETTLRKLQSMLIPNDFDERSLVLHIGSDMCTVSDSIPSNLGFKINAGARSCYTFTIPTADLHGLEKNDLNPAPNLILTENDGLRCSVPLEKQTASVIEGIKVISFVPAGSRGGGVPTMLENQDNPMVKRDVPKSRENKQSPFQEKNVPKLRESKQNTVTEREIDSLEYEALRYLLEESFTCCATRMNEKGGKITLSVPLAGDIGEKIDSLKQETIPLEENDLSKLKSPINARSERVEAFMKVIQKERKVVILCFDYNNMNKAKHLLQCMTGKIKTISRGNRKFVDGSSSTSSQQLSTNTHSQPADRVELNTKSGIKVSVYKANITKLPVDAIVNAANNHLQHCGGVAADIARAAGPSLEEEGDDYITNYGPLKVTQIISTKSGALPCKAVLHAVGPRWCDYQDKTQCQQDLLQTVFNCLETAHNMKFGSLAVSSIGSATFGVPKDMCAESYLQAVQRFDGQYGVTSCLRQIHFVDISDEMVFKIQDVFSQKWKSARHNVQSAVPVNTTQQNTTSMPQAAASGNGGKQKKTEYLLSYFNKRQ